MALPAEAVASMVVPNATVTNPAEGQIVLRDMQQRTVQRHASRDGAVKDRLACAPVIAEDIKRKRPRTVIDESERVVERRVSNDWQDRSEDFLVQKQAGFGCAETNVGAIFSP